MVATAFVVPPQTPPENPVMVLRPRELAVTVASPDASNATSAITNGGSVEVFTTLTLSAIRDLL
jgi:hypothetical protein